MGANREYKSSVFSLLFGEENTLRGLYEALEGVTLPSDLPITINTLEDALFRTRINDISFEAGEKLVVILENTVVRQKSVYPAPARIYRTV
jgi:hypothetical protein